jgi:tubulin delta
MSTVTIQLGQCGNQLGQQFFDILHQELVDARPSLKQSIVDTYFTVKEGKKTEGTLCARAALIDMEPKVVRTCLSYRANRLDTRPKSTLKTNVTQQCLSTDETYNQWQYEQGSYFCQQSGSANNWAFGFNRHGPAHEEAIMDLIATQVGGYAYLCLCIAILQRCIRCSSSYHED